MTWFVARRELRRVGGSLLALMLACSDDGAPQVGSSAADSAGTMGDAAGTGGDEGTSGADSNWTATDTGSDGDPETTGADTGQGGSSMPCGGDDDCRVVNDCCTCAAQHVDDEVSACERNCEVGMCQAQGKPETAAVCRFGACVFEKVSCDPMRVACDAPPPRCGEGRLPSVEGDCWGECVPAESCDVVPSCELCAANETCVEIQTQLGSNYACEVIPAACAGQPSCACMGEVCPEPWDTCHDGARGLECSCLAC